MTKDKTMRMALLLMITCVFCSSIQAVTVETVAEANFIELGEHTAVIDVEGNKHFFYGGKKLVHRYFDGAQWQQEIVDDAPNVGSNATVTIDDNGVFHVLYKSLYKPSPYSGSVGQGLKYAYGQTGSWTVEVTPINSFEAVNYELDRVAVDSASNVFLAYMNGSQIVVASRQLGAWSEEVVVDEGTQVSGKRVSLLIDSNDELHLVFLENQGDHLKYATKIDGSWAFQTISSSAIRSSLSYAASAFDMQDVLRVCFYKSSVNFEIPSLYCSVKNLDSWVEEKLDDAVYVSPGRVTLEIDDSGKSHVAYYVVENGYGYLKYAYGNTGDWRFSSTQLESSSPSFFSAISLLLNPDNTTDMFVMTSRATGVLEGNFPLRHYAWDGRAWFSSVIDFTWQEDNGVGYSSDLSIASDGGVHAVYSGVDGLGYSVKKSSVWQPDSSFEEFRESFGFLTAGISKVVIDDSGNTHIIFMSTIKNTGEGLYYLTNKTGEWVLNLAVGGYLALDLSVVLDSNGDLHVGYATAGSSSLYAPWQIRYVNNTSGEWVDSQVYEYIAPTAPNTIDQQTAVSVALSVEVSGTVTFAFLRVDAHGISRELMSATNASGAWVASTELDESVLVPVVYAGTHRVSWWEPSVVIDHNQKIYAAYNTLECDGLFCYPAGVKYSSNSSGVWQHKVIDSTVVLLESPYYYKSASSATLAVGQQGGVFAIYEHQAFEEIRLAELSGGIFQVDAIDAFSSTYTSSAGAYSFSSAVAVGNDRAVMSYFSVPNKELRYYENSVVLDSDDDGMPDFFEMLYGLDASSVDSLQDLDGDSVTNIDEFLQGTNPAQLDSDGDAIPDNFELFYGINPLVNDSNLDKDGDGITNLQEFQLNSNPSLFDSDSDGMNDYFEVFHSLNILINDAGGDQDLDGLTNLAEYLLYATNPSATDSDGDGLGDYDEVYTYATSPVNVDTDEDGMVDAWEISNSFNPLDTQDAAFDFDTDGWTNLQEQNYQSDPRDSASTPTPIGTSVIFESFEGWGPPLGWLKPEDANTGWFLSKAKASDGSQALRAGGVPGLSDYAVIEWRGFFAEGQFSFDLKLEEANSSLFYFYVDGVRQLNLTNKPQDWTAHQFSLLEGEHVFRWEYSQSTTAFPASAWLDNIRFIDYSSMDDTDSDGILDVWETQYQLNPFSVEDATEDWDGDGLNNLQEFNEGSSPLLVDSDDDGLSDTQEVQVYGTHPGSMDSDGDGATDGWELAYGFNPLDQQDGEGDQDADGYTNTEEFYLGTDPSDVNSLPVIENWFSYQGNAKHNGYLPYRLDVSDFNVRWTTDTFIEREAPLAQVAASDHNVFIVEDIQGLDLLDKDLVSLNLHTGITSWTHTYSSIYEIGAPAVANDKVYVQTKRNGGESDFYGFDVADGAVSFIESFPAQGGEYIAPTPYDGKVYAYGGYYGGAHAFDGQSGEDLWFSDLHQVSSWSPAVDELYVYAYAGKGLTILDRDTGLQLHETPYLEGGSDISNRAPLLTPYKSVLVIHNGRLVSFNTVRHKVNWAIVADFTGQPSAANGLVYAVNSGALDVRSETSGELLWSWAAPSGLPLVSNIVVTRTHVFVGTKEQTFAVSLVGRTSDWVYTASGQLSLSDGLLFVASDEGVLTAIGLGVGADADNDADGIADGWELFYGLDPSNPLDALLDGDGDGLTNGEEYVATANPNVVDSDGDGLSDYEEVTQYSTHPSISDSDNDGMSDSWEVLYGLAPLNFADAEEDADGDLYLNITEFEQATDPLSVQSKPEGIDFYIQSFEQAELPEGWSVPAPGWSIGVTDASDGFQSLEAIAPKSNSDYAVVEWSGLFVDGILRFDFKNSQESCCLSIYLEIDGVWAGPLASVAGSWETSSFVIPRGQHILRWKVNKRITAQATPAALLDNVMFVSPASLADTDGDGFSDGWEISNGFNPVVTGEELLDTDSDGLSNVQEYELGTNPVNSDSDGDGMGDNYEVSYGLDPTHNDAESDLDGDQLTNIEEYQLGTLTNNVDSDRDQMYDGFEVAYGLNPLVNDSAEDTDGDGFSNLEEFLAGTDPSDINSAPTSPLVKNDFNGDATSDILWRHQTTGATQIWLMNNGAKQTIKWPGKLTDLNWSIVDTGDFDGDGDSDLLWRNSSHGGTLIWQMQNGLMVSSSYPGKLTYATWKVEAVADFNGDGASDILWRDIVSGGTQLWPSANKQAALYPGKISNMNWQVEGAGDYNTDGTDDVLWRDQVTGGTQIWFMQNGAKTSNSYPGKLADLNWQVRGVGDVNANDSADTVWHNIATGGTQVWSGGLKIQGSYPGKLANLNWQLHHVGDYDGDGDSDLYWRDQTTGGTQLWFMQGGAKASNSYPGSLSDLQWQKR